MAILRVDERIESATAKLDRNGYATYQRVFQVIAEDYTTRQGAAVEAVRAIVDIGDAYSVLDPADGTTVIDSDAGAFCTDLSAALGSGADDGCTWDVTVTYGPAGGEVPTFPPNPLDHPIELSWGSQLVDEVIFLDRDGDPITNSAHDYFEENPPTRARYKIILNIQRNQATFSTTLAQSYKGTVNDADFTVVSETFAAGLVKCADITGKPIYHPDCGWYWVVSYSFEIDPNGWAYKPLDRGVRKLVSGSKVAITDAHGEPIADPDFLNGSGAVLTAGGTPIVLEFDIYPESNFDDFGFDYTNTPGY